MKLHRVEGGHSDWQNQTPEKDNLFQSMARSTRGIITPGNIISLSGLILTINGIRDVSKGRTKKGLAKILIGRLFDIADGAAAEATRTKSPIGEKVDSGVDKMLAFYGVYKLRNKLPDDLLASVFLYNSTSSLINLKAFFEDAEPHSSAEGKITTAMEWGLIVLNLANSYFEEKNPEINFSSELRTLNVASSAIGAKALMGYMKSERQK